MRGTKEYLLGNKAEIRTLAYRWWLLVYREIRQWLLDRLFPVEQGLLQESGVSHRLVSEGLHVGSTAFESSIGINTTLLVNELQYILSWKKCF